MMKKQPDTVVVSAKVPKTTRIALKRLAAERATTIQALLTAAIGRIVKPSPADNSL